MPARSSRRAYRSPRREEAARETRRAVLEAARRQFVQHGYWGTSLASIARAAGVSLATVKLVAGTKAQLLSATLRALMTRDERPVPLTQQPWWRDLLAERDPARLLAQWVSVARTTLERQGALFDVVWEAAPTEPEMAKMEREGSLGRWRDTREVMSALAELGALRSDLDVEAATDATWAIASPQVYRSLITRRGWSPDRWEAWLRDVLEKQLLSARRSPRQARTPTEDRSSVRGG
ncbi:MAG: TetR/AcrR family transcriptional regulator [Chloroflexota bacterium]|nr:TetR/AcrR family transcriptional regulator [Chloroflexota bacterium]